MITSINVLNLGKKEERNDKEKSLKGEKPHKASAQVVRRNTLI